MAATATLNTKVDEQEKQRFVATAESLGMNASTALKVFVRKFNECGGFPFEVRKAPAINYANDETLQAHMENGKLVVPVGWRDDDDE